MKRKNLPFLVLGLTLLVGITGYSVPGSEVDEAETDKETEAVVSVQDIETTDTSTEEERTLRTKLLMFQANP